MKKRIKIIGGGLAGAEAAYKLLQAGCGVDLYEMRPVRETPAHHTGNLAELVCSNSLKSEDPATAQGLLKAEMRALDSIILRAAEKCRVPAGGALAVDRERFSKTVEEILNGFPALAVIRKECTAIEPYTVVASGPLTSDALSEEILKRTGTEGLHFYDAAAPIVTAGSVDLQKAYYGSRYGKGEPDYLNCPLSREEYETFYRALVEAETVILKSFEKGSVFEGCMPVEVMAKRGEDALRYGPMRPVGLRDAEGNRAYAVVQLRKEDSYGELLNLVGFQTNLTFLEQRRVFGLIPALQNAEFVRYGVMHRNTYLNSPAFLTQYYNSKEDRTVFFAGQITGVEGYMESAMSGMLAGMNMVRILNGEEETVPPETTLMGSLSRFIASPSGNFQPMHVSFALVPALNEKVKKKDARREAYSERALRDIKQYIEKL